MRDFTSLLPRVGSRFTKWELIFGESSFNAELQYMYTYVYQWFKNVIMNEVSP